MFLWTEGRLGADRLVIAETYRKDGKTRSRVIHDFGPRANLTLDEVTRIARACRRGDVGLRRLLADVRGRKVA